MYTCMYICMCEAFLMFITLLAHTVSYAIALLSLPLLLHSNNRNNTKSVSHAAAVYCYIAAFSALCGCKAECGEIVSLSYVLLQFTAVFPSPHFTLHFILPYKITLLYAYINIYTICRMLHNIYGIVLYTIQPSLCSSLSL